MAPGVGLTGEPSAAPGPSRPLVFGLAALVTLAGILGALYLGAWAFEVRRFTTHERRLARLLGHAPTRSQLEQAFKDEGAQLIGSASDEASLHALARRLGGEKADALEASGRRHARTQAYAAGDMIYFIHYDGQDMMRGYELVSR